MCICVEREGGVGREREGGGRGTDRKENKSAIVLIHPFHNHLSSICLAGIVGTVVDTRGQKNSSIISEHRKERSN